MALALSALLLQLLIFFFASIVEANSPRKVYLVQMKLGGHPRYGSSSGHQDLLGEVLDDDSTVANALIYSYKESFTGFSASLTQNERQKLKMRREVLQVSRSRNLKLQTTRSWDLMNLTLAANRNQKVESELVVAIIDTGIWPYSELFSGNGPPPPAWKDKCENIICNNKIVGARSYLPKEGEDCKLDEEKSVIDVNGHGTHVASIVAGKEIKEASYFELAKGTMRGGVPNAKIAIYKTCWKIINKNGRKVSVCPDYTALKAVDDAIMDKVNIISYSQGYTRPQQLHNDHVSWSFLRALGEGILTSAATGNSGKNYSTVINGAPWIMTVAASLKDSFFETKLELEGEEKPITVYNTINTFDTQDSFYQILDKTTSTKSTRKRELVDESEDDLILSSRQNEIEKDVFFNVSKFNIVNKAIKQRAKGVIAWGDYKDIKEMEKLQVPIASIFLNEEKGASLREYYNKDNSKRGVKIYKSEEIKEKYGWKPTVAEMSSRGPNCDKFLKDILKPDIAAPGLDIVAGWPVGAKLLPNVPANDYRNLRFNILSGSSMACPHATGLALYVKSFNPNWSPSAIKSALMTTSTEMKDPGNGFAYGSGFLNATKVLDPGLIYEMNHQDYIYYMCKLGFNTEKLRSHVGDDKIDCSKTKIDQNVDLNYPTMTARVDLASEFTKVFHRTVTNVGTKTSTYIAKIEMGSENDFVVQVSVEPKEIHFSELKETKEFTVTVTWKSNQKLKKKVMMSNTWLTWMEHDGSRQVRSPIVIYSIAERAYACRKFPKN